MITLFYKDFFTQSPTVARQQLLFPEYKHEVKFFVFTVLCRLSPAMSFLR